MSRKLRWVTLVVTLTTVAAGCSKPKSLTSSSTSRTTTPSVAAPVQGDDTSTTTAAAAAAAAVQAAKAAAAARSGSQAVTGGGDQAQIDALGAKIHPQTTARRTPYYEGVGNNSIQLDFSYDATGCGVNVVDAITAAGGALPTQSQFYRPAPTSQSGVVADTKESVDLMVRYWNDHAFDAFSFAPAIRNLMGNDPKNQFYGRHLTYNLIDGGSNQCPDKTTAASKQASEQDHAFAVFNNLDGASPVGAYNMAADLNTVPADRRPMHFGSLWLSDSDYSKLAPYDWTQFATGSTITRQWASYICSKLAGANPVPGRAPTVTDPHKRVFGLVHTNAPEDERLASEFKGYLNQDCGRNIIAKEVEYDGTDFSKAQQNDPNLIVQLKTAGVTTVLMLTEPVQPLFQMTDAAGQNWHPEWVFSSFGYSDSNTVQRLYVNTGESDGDFGTSNLGVFGGFGFGAGDPFWMYHAYHQTAPDGKPCDPSSEAGMDHGGDPSTGAVAKYCKAPTALVTWYYTMLPAVSGILFAGPDLTPQTVSAGLQAFPSTRYGGNGPTTDPRPALVGAGPGRYGFVVDAVEWRWHSKWMSPQPEDKAGFVEYPDCERHYLQWPSQLAPNWEVNGANWTAWCGVAKDPYGNAAPDYPKTEPGDGTH